MSVVEQLQQEIKIMLQLYDTTSIWSNAIFLYIGNNYYRLKALTTTEGADNEHD